MKERNLDKGKKDGWQIGSLEKLRKNWKPGENHPRDPNFLHLRYIKIENGHIGYKRIKQ